MSEAMFKLWIFVNMHPRTIISDSLEFGAIFTFGLSLGIGNGPFA
jgi:hypothetical protein